MKFLNWVKSKGKANVAVIVGLDSPAVDAWLKGKSTPKPPAMVDLVKAGNGKFSYEDIIMDIAKVKKANSKKD